MKIEEVAKTMTRQEFFDKLNFIANGANVNGGKILGETISCPTDYNIDTLDFCHEYGYCKDCWENALKDIKFKDEFNNYNENKKEDKNDKNEINNMSFNWEGFINSDFAVHCNTEEKANDFLKECDKKGLRWSSGMKVTDENSWNDYHTETCYKNDCRTGISFANFEFYKTNDIKIVEWEISKNNKKEINNMSKEYSFKEVIANIKEGETYTLVQGNYRVEKIFMKNNIIEIVSTDEPVRVGGKERYIKEKSSVSFMDAIKAYEEGETIRCEINTDDYRGVCNEYKRDNDRNCGGCNIINLDGTPISTREILEGKWYIE